MKTQHCQHVRPRVWKNKKTRNYGRRKRPLVLVISPRTHLAWKTKTVRCSAGKIDDRRQYVSIVGSRPCSPRLSQNVFTLFCPRLLYVMLWLDVVEACYAMACKRPSRLQLANGSTTVEYNTTCDDLVFIVCGRGENWTNCFASLVRTAVGPTGHISGSGLLCVGGCVNNDLSIFFLYTSYSADLPSSRTWLYEDWAFLQNSIRQLCSWIVGRRAELSSVRFET